jgi:hypothetical protein
MHGMFCRNVQVVVPVLVVASAVAPLTYTFRIVESPRGAWASQDAT